MIRFLQTPGPAKKIVLGGILLVICVAMVITLVPGGILGDNFAGGARGTLAKVGNQEVTSLEVQNLARQIGRQQFGGRVPEQLVPFLMQQAANSLILQKAMLQEADRLGLRVTDAELRDALRQGEFGRALFPNGNFVGQEAYDNFVAQNFGMGVQQFEQLFKTQLALNKLQSAIAAGVGVTDDEVQKEFQKQNTKVKLDYALLTADELAKQVKPAESELRAFYEAGKNTRYASSSPEKRKLKYIVVDTSNIVEQAKNQIKPAEIEAFYQQNQDQYRVPESAKVSHILIKTPPPGPDGKVDAKGDAEARQKAEDILKKLRSGANFAEMAKKESQDPGSAKNGGSLGTIERGRTVPEFEQASFSQPVGKIGDLVKSTYGYHIIRVDERTEAHLKPLSEVRNSIADTLAQQRAATAGDQLANRVLNAARSGGLEKAAAENHLNVVTTDWVKRSDSLPGVGVNGEFMAAAFNQQKGGQPELAKTAQGYAVVQAVDVKPASAATFEEIRNQVEGEFKQERAVGMLGRKARELADRARALHDLKKAAKELNVPVKTSELVTIDSQVPDLGGMSGPVSVAFDMKPGEISDAINIPAGETIIQIAEKQQPSAEDYAKKREQIRETLVQKKRRDRMDLFSGSLRARMEKDGSIRINQEEWNRLFGSAPQQG
ncbi:MAG TPA: peptidylprolyl isomerase [Terriglobales bacterium]|nr:peptidylprolyl isomerase [Terriglobales bacterium]